MEGVGGKLAESVPIDDDGREGFEERNRHNNLQQKFVAVLHIVYRNAIL